MLLSCFLSNVQRLYVQKITLNISPIFQYEQKW